MAHPREALGHKAKTVTRTLDQGQAQVLAFIFAYISQTSNKLSRSLSVFFFVWFREISSSSASTLVMKVWSHK